ncbi:MAG: PAS domain S-box protein [Thermoplasmatales archaeon]|nr:MAG: PAS domain S-box protein [Thermoplasmatales archaeon]
MCFAVSLIPIGIIGGIQGFESTSMALISLIALVTFSVSIVISYLISKSIEKLTKNIADISKGKLDVELEKSEIYEINKLTESLNRVMASLKLAIHKVGVKKGEIFEEAVKAKEAVEEKYCDLLDNISGWAWETDEKGNYTFCSKNVIHALGYNPEDLMGKNIFDFMPSEESKKAKRIFNESSKKKEPIKNLENWYENKNDEKICMMANGVPIFDDNGNLQGYRGVNIDVTANKESEAKINDLNAELQDLKERVTNLLSERKKKKNRKVFGIEKKIEEKWSERDFDSVFLFDEKANILDCNDNMSKNLGYTKSELLSLNLTDFDALESKKDIFNKIEEAKKNGSISFKTIHKRKDGSAILVHENLQYLKDKNMFKCIARKDYSSEK